MSGNQQLPLLLFPSPSRTDRENRNASPPQIHLPNAGRQGVRLGPKFNALRSAFETQRLQLQQESPADNPELVLVLETIGSIDRLIGAAGRIEGLEWLMEADELIESDEDFFDRKNQEKPLSGSLFLLGSNQQALSQIIALWENYQENPDVKFERGFAAWKELFKHLKDVRFWSGKDRLGRDILTYWEERLASGEDPIRFEIETWCFVSSEKNTSTANELRQLLASSNGRILATSLIYEIGYHGFLVELPADGIRSLLNTTQSELIQFDRIMHFRPRGQAIAPTSDHNEKLQSVEPPTALPVNPPVVALLDGLPLQNHPLLANRLQVDDPDGWEADYAADDRQHGTAMASLIALAELDGLKTPLNSRIYVRPILKPNLASFIRPRPECTPNDILLIDLVHRAVRRMFESDGTEPATANTVKVINLSVGDPEKVFDRGMSAWARLLDWLSCKYQVLFIVSAGNVLENLDLATPRDTLITLTSDERHQLAIKALLDNTTNKRLIAPAESINAITVGAVHLDGSTGGHPPSFYNLFPDNSIAAYSRIGHGFRRAVKPDILMPGGRMLHKQALLCPPAITQVEPIDKTTLPGHKVATPPNAADQNTKYTRGTSNAAALATRSAAFAHQVIESLRAADSQSLPAKYDAVLIKALLAHGASWDQLQPIILDARPDIAQRLKQQDLITRFAGYGFADIDKALICTEQRATLIGVGDLKNGEALEFEAPLPPSLIAKTEKRRLTLTLAWFTPINAKNAKYRTARLWIQPPADELGVSRLNCEWRQVQRGTLQHEILEGKSALAFVDGQKVIFKVNCSEDGGKISTPIQFALCVTLEVAEGVSLPIYNEIRTRIAPQVSVLANA